MSPGSNVSFGSHGPVPFSIHLSGMVNGITQVSALAGDTSAVAIAPTSTLRRPKKVPISVGTALLRAVVRNTCTWTRLFCPEGDSGNVTSAGCTDTAPPATLLLVDVLMALSTAGPLGLRS